MPGRYLLCQKKRHRKMGDRSEVRTRIFRRKAPLALVAGALMLGAQTTAGSDQLDQVLEIGEGIQLAAVKSQERIDKLANDTDKLLGEYRTVNEQIDSLRNYNGQLGTLIASQTEEIGSLNSQIEDVTMVERQIMPLMNRMINALEDFVERDVPFLVEERASRVSNLLEMMRRADVTVAEKYRRLVEAYQIENEYGRTIESYSGELQIGDGPLRTVDFLRFGRVVLIYTTLDGGEAGVWDGNTGSWRELDGSYRAAVRQGLRIARQQTAPDLVVLPIRAPQTVGSASTAQVSQ